MIVEALFAHSAIVYFPCGLITTGDEGEVDGCRFYATDEKHRGIAFALDAAFGGVKHYVVAIRILLVLHEHIVVKTLIVAEERDGFAAGRMAGKAVVLVVGVARIVDNGDDKIAATVIVEEAAVE